ncbi:DUF6879 family protein [Streptomyces sp. NPDC048385]
MTRPPTFEELFRDCQRTAAHLEMRDAYMKSAPRSSAASVTTASGRRHG